MLTVAFIGGAFWAGWVVGTKRPWLEFFPAMAKDLRKWLKKKSKSK